MTRVIIRAAIAAFLSLQFGAAYAVPVLFKTNSSILVRTPQGIVAKPGIGELLSTVPNSASSVKALGSFPFGIGNASVNIPVTKTFTGASIARKAADLIMSRTALGLVSTLALPYVIDQATDMLMRQSGTPDSPPGQYCAFSFGFCPGQENYPGYLSTSTSQAGSDACSVIGESLIGVTGPNANNEYVYTCTGSNQGLIRTYAPTCTAPSYFDAATGLCVGSAINEPANAETLAADIEATFNDNPTFPKVALDTVLENDQEPDGGDQEIDMPSPQTVQGEKKTSVKNYNDPATGRPVQEETTEQTDYKVEKSGKNQLDVKPNVTTTISITDTITNTTTTTTNVTQVTPSEATTQSPPEEPDYTFNAAPPEFDTNVDIPEKKSLETTYDGFKNEIDTWSSGIGISATGGQCAITEGWGMGGATGNAVLSFCEWESQLGMIGAFIVMFAALYGAFIIMGVRD